MPYGTTSPQGIRFYGLLRRNMAFDANEKRLKEDHKHHHDTSGDQKYCEALADTLERFKHLPKRQGQLWGFFGGTLCTKLRPQAFDQFSHCHAPPVPRVFCSSRRKPKSHRSRSISVAYFCLTHLSARRRRGRRTCHCGRPCDLT